ncbi:Spo0J and IME4 domain-containing protein [Pelagibacterium montanilacus]|uniref:Spo0J and IME4 domain-containing protein n=1 Tax=Pelagibacterium montanilacus TaxID=2185280 RepID=UPI000F8D4D9A|nr:MT-A70 family methyltransferase [Pelagibacterium montanilacus]
MLEFHPLADLFPLIEGREFDELVADVKAHGVLEPVVIHDDKILDGRNRYRAALAAGVIDETAPPDYGGWARPYGFQVYGWPEPSSPLAWVLAKNLHRRHLNESQRAMVAAKIARLERGRPRTQDKPAPEKPADLPVSKDASIKQADAADALHVSERSVRTARQVIESAAPEVVAAIERGELTVSAAVDLASLPLAQQQEAIRNADPAALYAVIKQERAKKQEDKKRRRAEREAELGRRQMAWPEKRYGVILADPEWKFVVWNEDSGSDRAASNHYPVSDTEALLKDRAAMIRAIAAPDSLLLVWATAPMTEHAYAFARACGFVPKTHFVGVKPHAGTGYIARNRHELLIYATRGDIPGPAMGEQYDSVFEFPVGVHSEKPDFAHQLAEAYFPNLPKIELNARDARPGWDAWGLEAPDQDDRGSLSGGESTAHQGAEVAAARYRAELERIGDQFGNLSMAEATTALRLGREAGVSPYAIAEDLGHPVGTVKTWLNRLGLTDLGRMKAINARAAAKWGAA